MRFAILSDIHANLTALQAVLDDVQRRGGADQLWCLGDIVGYGPDPSECIALLRQFDHRCVAGNHDWGAVGKISAADFNDHALAACLWTRQQLSADEARYLEGLPLTIKHGDFTLVHGSPRDPVWEYLLYADEAQETFPYFDTSYCLVGHSHLCVLFESLGDGGPTVESRPLCSTLIKLGGHRLIANPGGVGQPRDGDPRASYMILDDEQRTLHSYRVPYDIAKTQERMRDRGLPGWLIERLSHGY